MILDRLETSDGYDALGARFAAGFKYLRETDLENLPDGTYEILGRDVYAIVQTYVPKPQPEGRWEGHRTRADIQYIVRGVERMGVARVADVALQASYDTEKDVEFYAGDASAGQLFRVDAGTFAVFFPHDIHMPSLALDGAPAENVKKVVVKVRLR